MGALGEEISIGKFRSFELVTKSDKGIIDFVTNSEFLMPRGGQREGAGGISTWNHGKTKTIRVPIALAEQLLEMAREMDNGEKLTLNQKVIEPVTESKVVDLSGVRLTHLNGEIAIRLEDLVKLGYQLHPASLAQMVEARMQRKYGL